MESLATEMACDQVALPILSLPQLALLLLLILPFAVLLGFQFVSATRRKLLKQDKEVDSRVAAATIGAILAIHGLLLAFSFNNALTLSHNAQTALINEAGALGTAFARADYLPEPGRSEMMHALHRYTGTRIIPSSREINTLEKAAAFLQVSLEAQSRLWPLTVKYTADPVSDPIMVFFAGAINEVLDAHHIRMQPFFDPMSLLAQFMVLGTALTALFLSGNRCALLGTPLNWRAFALPAEIFVVMQTTADMQRIGEGLIRMENGALRLTNSEMEAALLQ